MTKNQLVTVTIESLSSDGSGVAHVDGQAVFVPSAAPGDVARVRIVKVLKHYAFGRLEGILAPGPDRIEPDCPVAAPCGGCGLRHLRYEAECEAKTRFVQDAFSRLGGLDADVLPVIGAGETRRYRNKVQLPVGVGPDGRLTTGFYAGRSHRLVPCPDCLLQPEWMNQAAARACELLSDAGASAYDETTGKGLVRHLYLRQGWHSGQRLLCFVVNGSSLPRERQICETLAREFALTTLLVNRNTDRTNVILGRETRTVVGPGVIEDTLAGVLIAMGVQEFYQVNTPAAELLYEKARLLAALRPGDVLLDLYCGMGTIGLSMVRRTPGCRLVGVEVVPQAVEGAKATAGRLGADAEFWCMDAGQAATRLAAQGLRPDVIVVDPPRKGCDGATLNALVEMAPRTIVMVSCNAATAARDARFLVEHGYSLGQVQPVDLFPRTRHVEVVVQFSRKTVEGGSVPL